MNTLKRKFQGKVVSNKMDKTVVILLQRHKTHPMYKKRFLVTTKFKAHDENNSCKMGDVVEITETKPFSKYKHFVVSKVIKTGELK